MAALGWFASLNKHRKCARIGNDWLAAVTAAALGASTTKFRVSITGNTTVSPLADGFTMGLLAAFFGAHAARAHRFSEKAVSGAYQ